MKTQHFSRTAILAAILPVLFLMFLVPAMGQDYNKNAYNLMPSGNIVPLGQAPKYALVIGNADYTYINKLKSPVLDARAMRDALESLGVTVFYYENLTLQQMENAVNNFEKKLTPDCWAFFYFSGHGVEYADQYSQTATNYLLPVNIGDIPKSEIKFKTFSADLAIEKMTEKVTNGPKIIILDACRVNPFSYAKSASSKGLSPMTAMGNTLLAFAAAPGYAAFDGGNGNLSPYTASLVKYLNAEGLKLEELFSMVSKEVIQVTDRDQKPWLIHSLEGDYYLSPITDATTTTATLIVYTSPAGYLTVGSTINENLVANSQNTYKLPQGSYTLKFTYGSGAKTYTESLELTAGQIKRVIIANESESTNIFTGTEIRQENTDYRNDVPDNSKKKLCLIVNSMDVSIGYGGGTYTFEEVWSDHGLLIHTGQASSTEPTYNLTLGYWEGYVDDYYVKVTGIDEEANYVIGTFDENLNAANFFNLVGPTIIEVFSPDGLIIAETSVDGKYKPSEESLLDFQLREPDKKTPADYISGEIGYSLLLGFKRGGRVSSGVLIPMCLSASLNPKTMDFFLMPGIGFGPKLDKFTMTFMIYPVNFTKNNSGFQPDGGWSVQASWFPKDKFGFGLQAGQFFEDSQEDFKMYKVGLVIHLF